MLTNHQQSLSKPKQHKNKWFSKSNWRKQSMCRIKKSM